MNVSMNFNKALFVIGILFSINTVKSQTIVHDPVMIKQGDTFHLFCTGPGITHKTSKDLVNWEDQKPVFAESPKWTFDINPTFNGHIWAPDIYLNKGTYYLYYSISAFGKNTSAIGVTTNTTLNVNDPNYQWIDHGIVVESVPNRDMWNAIDPNIIFDEKGTAWMSFGSFWGGIKMVKLHENLLEVHPDNEWYTLARRERSFEQPDSDAGDAPIEGPFIYKRGAYYYLFVSWDYCCRGAESTYKTVVGRSKNLLGPYLDKDGVSLFNGGGTLVVEGNKEWNGIGHNSIYDFDGATYFISHAYDAAHNGRPILKIIPTEFDKEGWPIQLKISDNIAK